MTPRRSAPPWHQRLDLQFVLGEFMLVVALHELRRRGEHRLHVAGDTIGEGGQATRALQPGGGSDGARHLNLIAEPLDLEVRD